MVWRQRSIGFRGRLQLWRARDVRRLGTIPKDAGQLGCLEVEVGQYRVRILDGVHERLKTLDKLVRIPAWQVVADEGCLQRQPAQEELAAGAEENPGLWLLARRAGR